MTLAGRLREASIDVAEISRRRDADRALHHAAARRRPRCGRATTCSSIARRSAWARRPSTTARCAIVSTVVSRPAPTRVVFDAGSKTLTTDGAARLRHARRARAGVPGPRRHDPGRVDRRSSGCPRSTPSRACRRTARCASAIACASCRITPASSQNLMDELLVVEGDDLSSDDGYPVAAPAAGSGTSLAQSRSHGPDPFPAKRSAWSRPAVSSA